MPAHRLPDLYPFPRRYPLPREAERLERDLVERERAEAILLLITAFIPPLFVASPIMTVSTTRDSRMVFLRPNMASWSLAASQQVCSHP